MRMHFAEVALKRVGGARSRHDHRLACRYAHKLFLIFYDVKIARATHVYNMFTAQSMFFRPLLRPRRYPGGIVSHVGFYVFP
jgi:hypothetical protein